VVIVGTFFLIQGGLFAGILSSFGR